MQYAILTDDMQLVEYLKNKGASIDFIYPCDYSGWITPDEKIFLDEGVNYTWDFVQSDKMKKYLEAHIGKEEYSNMDNDSKKYHLSLIAKK